MISLLLLCLCLTACTPAPCWIQEQELQELLPNTEITLADIPGSVASEIVRAFKDCKEQYPIATQYIKEIKTDYAISKKQSFPLAYFALTQTAGWQPYNTILFNDALLQSLTSVRKQYKTSEWLGWHVQVPRNDEMYAIVMHELAHVLIANTMLHNDVEIINLYQLYKIQASEGKDFATNASLNIWEFIAECFVDHMCNKDKANGISQSVMKVINKRLKIS